MIHQYQRVIARTRLSFNIALGYSNEKILIVKGETDPAAVKGMSADLQSRLAAIEHKLSGLGRLVG